MEYLDEVSKEAKSIGAVNTIKFDSGKTIGYNTDYFGIGMLFTKNSIKVENKKATIFGNGGVAVTMVQYLLDNGISEITIVTRNVLKLKGNSRFILCKLISYDEAASIKEPSIAINCTPLGMYPNLKNSPIEKEYINKFTSAVDMIYNPHETLFLKYAKDYSRAWVLFKNMTDEPDCCADPTRLQEPGCSGRPMRSNICLHWTSMEFMKSMNLFIYVNYVIDDNAESVCMFKSFGRRWVASG